MNSLKRPQISIPSVLISQKEILKIGERTIQRCKKLLWGVSAPSTVHVMVDKSEGPTYIRLRECDLASYSAIA